MAGAGQSLIWIDVGEALRDIAQRRDIPRALVDASRFHLHHGREPEATMAAAIGSGRQQGIITALLTLDARAQLETGNGQATRPVAELLTVDGRLRGGDEERIVAVGITKAETSLYQEGLYQEGLSHEGVWEGPPKQRTFGMAVALQFSGDQIADVSVAMSGIAAQPVRARLVEGALRGRRRSAALVKTAAETAQAEAQPAGGGNVLGREEMRVLAHLCKSALEAAILVAEG